MDFFCNVAGKRSSQQFCNHAEQLPRQPLEIIAGDEIWVDFRKAVIAIKGSGCIERDRDDADATMDGAAELASAKRNDARRRCDELDRELFLLCKSLEHLHKLADGNFLFTLAPRMHRKKICCLAKLQIKLHAVIAAASDVLDVSILNDVRNEVQDILCIDKQDGRPSEKGLYLVERQTVAEETLSILSTNGVHDGTRAVSMRLMASSESAASSMTALNRL